MIDMSKYGESLFSYQGYGEINFANIKMEKCIFEVRQFKDGTIRLCCSFTHFFQLPLNGSLNVSGQTKKGEKLLMSGDAIKNAANHTMVNDGSTSASYNLAFILFGDTKLQIGEPTWIEKANIHFGLTNFNFIGNEMSEVEGGLSLITLQFSLQNQQIRIRQIPGYKEQLEVLDATKGSDVICEIIFEVNSHKEFNLSIEIAENISLLLSLARGTLLSSPYFQIVHEGKIIYTEHKVPKKGSYSGGFPIIDPNYGNDTKQFLEATYNNYVELKEIYNIQAVIELYVEIRTRGFLESRILTIAAIAEYFAGTFAKSKKQENVMSKKLFSNFTDHLKNSIQAWTQKNNSSLNESQIWELETKIGNFNHRSFRPRLNDLIEYFKVPITDEEIRDFVKSRNELVHYMRFKTSDAAGEFRAMLHLTDKLFIAMLGYEGSYLNATTSPLERQDFKLTS